MLNIKTEFYSDDLVNDVLPPTYYGDITRDDARKLVEAVFKYCGVFGDEITINRIVVVVSPYGKHASRTENRETARLEKGGVVYE